MPVRALPALVAFVMTLALASPAAAQEESPRGLAAEPSSPVITGNGWDKLRFTGEPDGDGLLYSVGIPASPERAWPIAVLNVGDDTLSDVHLRAHEAQQDGDALVFAADVRIWPADLGPGEMGVGVMKSDQGGAGPEDGLAASFHLALLDGPAKRSDHRMLTLTGGGFRDGIFLATVSNGTEEVADPVEIHVLCLDDSGDGVLTSYFVTVDYTDPLEPGASHVVSLNSGEVPSCAYVFAFALGVSAA